MNECGDSSSGPLAAGGQRWLGGILVAWHVAARAVGVAGERVVQGIVNLPKNSDFLRDTISGTSRVPDFWNRSTNTIIEVKNVSQLGFTSQIRDMAAWAAKEGGTFELWVRDGATLSPELQTAINNGLVTLKTFQWP